MAQVDLLKRTSDEGERTVAELASLNQKIREVQMLVLQLSLLSVSAGFDITGMYVRTYRVALLM